MTLEDVTHNAYWAQYHRRPVSDWEPALAVIADESGIAITSPTQSPLGRNVVFLTDDVVVKLVPPFWEHMARREARALTVVSGHLPVDTPTLLADGAVDGWSYIIMDRLVGDPYGRRGELGDDRLGLAYDQGVIVAAISDLDLDAALAMDWDALLAEQRAELELDALPDELAASALDYIDEAGDLASGRQVFLHGDVSSINLISTPGRGLALVDWSDAVLGPVDHEFISPIMHQFRGDGAELDAFWDGYGTVDDPTETTHRAMARSILKYATLLPRYLDDLPGRMPRSWVEAAERFCRIPGVA